MEFQKPDTDAKTVYCLDLDVLDRVGRFVELMGWVGVLEGEVGL